jgi:hypothetical protein
MENKELIIKLESLADSCNSDHALEINGYNRGVLDAIDLVNRHFVEQSSQPINSGLPITQVVFFKLIDCKYMTENNIQITTEFLSKHQFAIYHDSGYLILTP